MEKYHIYDEIGKGDFSQVFKGREKKQIEYVAIKRVDKSMMNKIVNEVQTMHRLESAHTIRFHDWYETKNNLWLILEYCTGADLLSLLKQDGHLPETSVRLFGVDIMAALAYLHSNGLIHCDLRPANMLIDEYGILKLSDFKFVRKVPKIPEAADNRLAQQLPVLALGYTSPECLSLEGVPSFASDFWSVGCVLYQLRRGYLPYGAHCGDSVPMSNDVPSTIGPSVAKQLYSAIQNTDRVFDVPHPSTGIRVDYSKVPGVSAVFADLVTWLLEADPIYRANWRSIPNHPFWSPKTCTAPASLPPEPAFETYIKKLELTEQMQEAQYFEMKYDEESPIKRKTEAVNNSKANVPSVVASDTGVQRLPVSAGDSINNTERDKKNASRDGLEGHTKHVSSTDLLFCAYDNQVRPIVNNKAIEVIERPPFKASGLPCAPMSIQQIPNLLPAELEAHLTKIYKALHKSMSGCISHATPSSNPSTGPVTSASGAAAQQQQVQIYTDRINSLLGYLCTLAPSPEIANVVMNTQFLSVLLRILLMVVSRHKHMNVPGVSSRLQSPVGKPSSRTTSVLAAQVHISSLITDSACLAATALALMLRYATYVQPAPYQPDVSVASTPDKKSKGNSPGSPSMSQVNSPGDSSSTSPNIIAALIASMRVVDSELALHPTSGNSNTNSASNTPNKHTASSLNRTARSPGYTASTAGSSGTASVDGILKLKLRLTAALGELAFYVSAQDTAAVDDRHPSPRWHLPRDVWEILIECINSNATGSDHGSSTNSKRHTGKPTENFAEITKHYATKTIENILTTGGGKIIFEALCESEDRTQLFSSPPGSRPSRRAPSLGLGLSLLETAHRAGSEHLQVSSAMAFGHLLKCILHTLLSTKRQSTVKAEQQALSDIVQNGIAERDTSKRAHEALLQCVFNMQDASVKLQHAYLNVLNVILHYCNVKDSEGTGAGVIKNILEPWRAVLCDSRTPLLPVITALIEQSSSAIVRAKALLCIQLLDSCCRNRSSNRVLRSLGDNRRFITALTRCLEATEGMSENSITHLNNSSLLASPSIHKDKNSNGGHSTSQKYLGQCAYRFAWHVQSVLLFHLSFIESTLSRATGAMLVDDSQAPAGVANDCKIAITEACTLTQRIAISFDTVRACVATSSSPLLLKLALCNSTVLGRSGDLVKKIKPAQLQFLTLTQLWKRNGAIAGQNAALVQSYNDMLTTAEQVALSVMESIAQLEVHIEAVTSAVAIGMNLESYASAEENNNSIVDHGADMKTNTMNVYLAFVSEVVPAALQLLSEPSTGDVRVLVSVCLRRLLPNLVNAVCNLYPGELFRAVVGYIEGSATSRQIELSQSIVSRLLSCVSAVVKCLPQLLSDKAPVPQYAVRLLADVVTESHSIAILISFELHSDVKRCGGALSSDSVSVVQFKAQHRPILVDILSRMLPAVAASLYVPDNESQKYNNDLEEEHTNPTDPQTGVLIRILLEKSSANEVSKYCAELMAIGVNVPTDNMNAIHYINDALLNALLNSGFCWTLREAMEWCVVQNNADHLCVLLDLLQRYLELIISRTGGSDKEEIGSITDMLSQRNAIAESIMTVAQWLSGIVSYISNRGTMSLSTGGSQWSAIVRCFAIPDKTSAGEFPIDTNTLHLIQDGCVVCVTLLSELSPAHFIKLLVDAPTDRAITSVKTSYSPPHLITSLAETLASVQADIKVRIRYMKMLIASCKTCTSFGGLESEIRIAFTNTSSELHGAIVRCAREDHNANFGTSPGGSDRDGEKAIYVSFQRLAANFVLFLESQRTA